MELDPAISEIEGHQERRLQTRNVKKEAIQAKRGGGWPWGLGPATFYRGGGKRGDGKGGKNSCTLRQIDLMKFVEVFGRQSREIFCASERKKRRTKYNNGQKLKGRGKDGSCKGPMKRGKEMGGC